MGKRQNPSVGFFLIASLAAVILLAPILFIYRAALPRIPALVWLLVSLAGICQAVYYIGLAGAYRHGDLSIAYPLARALPVLWVASIRLAWGSQGIHPLGLLGMAGVAAGCLVLPLRSFRSLRTELFINWCCAFAVLTALGTTGYTLTDDQALRTLRADTELGLSGQANTLLYVELESMTTALALLVYILAHPPERRLLGQLLNPNLRNQPIIKQASPLMVAALTGIIITATYGLVLAAMAYVTDVSYVAAFRQLSIPLGALAGIFLQKEPADPPRLLGLALISTGLVIVAIK